MTRFKAGQLVQHLNGQIGVVTDDHVRAQGVNKGRLAVMFIGSPWEVAESPKNLRHITLADAAKATAE